MAPIVVTVVIMTEIATSPFAMYVQRLEPWPPLIEPMTDEDHASGEGRREAEYFGETERHCRHQTIAHEQTETTGLLSTRFEKELGA